MVGEEDATNGVENQTFLYQKPIAFIALDWNKENLNYNFRSIQGYKSLSSLPNHFMKACDRDFVKACDYGGVRIKTGLSCSEKQKASEEHSRSSVYEANMKTNEDKTPENETSSVKANCKHSSLGCQWVGELSKVEKHLQTICDYQPVRCTVSKCWSIIHRKDLQAHVRNCEWRPVKCSYCPSMITSRKMEKHLTKCTGFPVMCTNGCEMNIAKREMSRHTDIIRGDCPMTEVPCKYERIGCLVKVKRKRLGEHMSCAQGDHLELMSKRLKIVESENSDLRKRVQKQEKSLANQSRQIAILKKALTTDEIYNSFDP